MCGYMCTYPTPYPLPIQAKINRAEDSGQNCLMITSILQLYMSITPTVYSHNDTCIAFNSPSKQILIEASNAQLIQQASGKALYGTINSINNYNKSFDSFIHPISPGDSYVHHAIALGLHMSR